MNTSTNNSSNEAENGNKSKPLLCEVAVICPSFRDYKIWLRENEEPNKKYTWVYRLDCVLGKRFDRVEKIFRYYNIQDINDIFDYLETHTVFKHQNIKREDGLDECLDCGARNY